MTNPPPPPQKFTWIGVSHSKDGTHMTENQQLLQAVRLRIQAATCAREILSDDAPLGDILALAEWLMGGAGEEFMEPDADLPSHPNTIGIFPPYEGPR